MNEEAVRRLVKSIDEYLPDMSMLCGSIMFDLSSENTNKTNVKAHAGALKIIHYKIGNYIEEIESHIYDGEIDNG